MIATECQHADGTWHPLATGYLDRVAAEQHAKSVCLWWRVIEDDRVVVQGPER